MGAPGKKEKSSRMRPAVLGGMTVREKLLSMKVNETWFVSVEEIPAEQIRHVATRLNEAKKPRQWMVCRGIRDPRRTVVSRLT